MPVMGNAQTSKKKKFIYYTKQGYLASSNQDWKTCITSYKKALSYIKSAKAYYSAARCWEESGKKNIALDYYRFALNAKVDELKGSVRTKTEKRIEQLTREFETQQKLKTALSIASNAFVKKQYDVALKHYREAYGYDKSAQYLLDAALSAQQLKWFEDALVLVDRALSHSSKPLNKRSRKRAQVLKKELVLQIEAKKKAEEEARWTTQRVDWKTYAGLSAMSVGGAFVGTALGYFGRTARQKLDAVNENDEGEVIQVNQEVSRLQSQGWAVFWIGVGLSAVGTGLVVYDLSTVERVRRKEPAKPQTRLILGATGAAVEVSF